MGICKWPMTHGCKGAGEGCKDEGDLLQQLVTFPANFPIDFLGRLAEKVIKGNNVVGDY